MEFLHYNFEGDEGKLSDLQELINAPLNIRIRAHKKQDKYYGKIAEVLI